MSSGLIVGFVAGLAGAITVGVLTSLLTKEAEGWIDALPGLLLRLARRRVPTSHRDTLYDEWAAELHAALNGVEGRPLSQVFFGIRYATGLLRAARQIADELGPVRHSSPEDLADVTASTLIEAPPVIGWHSFDPLFRAEVRKRYRPLEVLFELLELRDQTEHPIQVVGEVLTPDTAAHGTNSQQASPLQVRLPSRPALVAGQRVLLTRASPAGYWRAQARVDAVEDDGGGSLITLEALRAPVGFGETITITRTAPSAMRRHHAALRQFLAGQVEGNLGDLALLLNRPSQLRVEPIEIASAEDGCEYRLNHEQRRAVAGALATPHAFAIQGPPGTGRTAVLVETVRRLVARGERVLFLAPTYAAVDEVLRRVADADGVSALRVTRAPERVAEDLRRFLPQHDGQEAQGRQNTANLICATTTGLTDQYLNDADYDTLILDDAGRVIESEFLISAIRARRWILAGDEHQLPPYIDQNDVDHLHALCALHMVDRGAASDLPIAVERLADFGQEDAELQPFRRKSVLARATSLDESHTWQTVYRDTFSRAFRYQGPDADIERQLLRAMLDHLVDSVFDRCVSRLPVSLRHELVVQHRMPEPIAALVKDAVYSGRLHTVARPGPTPVTAAILPTPVVLMDTSSQGSRQAGSRFVGTTGFLNELESEWIFKACRSLDAEMQRSGECPITVSVLTFYQAQAVAIRNRLGLPHGDFHALKFQAVDTIDRIQGQESDLVIVSFSRRYRRARQNTPPAGFAKSLQDVRRLNITCTRARRALLLVGHAPTLRQLNGIPEAQEFYANLFRMLDTHPQMSIIRNPNFT